MKLRVLFLSLAIVLTSSALAADDDPAQEPSVRAVAKAMPAVVNINTESVVTRTVRDPMDSLFNDFFGGAMRPPRTIKQKTAYAINAGDWSSDVCSSDLRPAAVAGIDGRIRLHEVLILDVANGHARSEERRVGKEC